MLCTTVRNWCKDKSKARKQIHRQYYHTRENNKIINEKINSSFKTYLFIRTTTVVAITETIIIEPTTPRAIIPPRLSFAW